jgi:Holliday junction resolvase
VNGKAKGSRAERRAIRILEAAGYVCTKAGGSLGPSDVIGIGPSDVRCIQVKANE